MYFLRVGLDAIFSGLVATFSYMVATCFHMFDVFSVFELDWLLPTLGRALTFPALRTEEERHDAATISHRLSPQNDTISCRSDAEIWTRDNVFQRHVQVYFSREHFSGIFRAFPGIFRGRMTQVRRAAAQRLSPVAEPLPSGRLEVVCGSVRAHKCR